MQEALKNRSPPSNVPPHQKYPDIETSIALTKRYRKRIRFEPWRCYCAQGAEGSFGEIFLVKTWNTTQDLSSWSAQASLSQHSLAWHDFDLAFRRPWLGMILILPLGILAQVHRNGYFLQAWSGWPESHLTLLPPEPLPRRPTNHGEYFGRFSR